MWGRVFLYKNSNSKVSVIVFISVYITSIIGAGFASGQEIYFYFTRYKFAGMLGLLAFGILLFVITYICTRAFYNTDKKMSDWSYMDFPIYLGKYAVFFTSAVVIMLSFGMMCIMVSGLTNIVRDYFDSEFTLWIIVAVIYVVLNFRLEGIKLVGTISTPIVIVIMLFVIFYNGESSVVDKQIVEINVDSIWIAMWNSIIYVGYNSVLPIIMCADLIKGGISKKNLAVSVIFGPMLILMMTLCLNGRLLSLPSWCLVSDMPILEYARTINQNIGVLYWISIAVAMFSSAVVCGYSLVEAISIRIKYKNKKVLLLAICFVVGIISKKGFVWLVANLYPIIGIGGVLMILLHLPGWIHSWR